MLDADGKPWAPTYLRTVNNQLNAIFNHAELYHGLTDNPMRRIDKIGSKKGGEMQLWTKGEYLRFSETVMDRSLSFHAFEPLYWTGISCGELLSLAPSDFMLDSSRLRINKSYQGLRGVDTVADPKTAKSVRTIVMPAFLRDEMAGFIELRDNVDPDERPFAGSVPKVGVGLGSRGLPQAVRGTENRLECRHSSACYAAFLPGIGLSATASAMILAACSAAVPS